MRTARSRSGRNNRVLVTWWQKLALPSRMKEHFGFWIFHKSPKTKKLSHELTKAVFKTAVRERKRNKKKRNPPNRRGVHCFLKYANAIRFLSGADCLKGNPQQFENAERFLKANAFIFKAAFFQHLPLLSRQ